MNTADDFGINKASYKINIQNKDEIQQDKQSKEYKIQTIISRYVPLPSDRSIPQSVKSVKSSINGIKASLKHDFKPDFTNEIEIPEFASKREGIFISSTKNA